MREVLRSEFGDLARLATRLPRPSIAATSGIWLALAAAGTAWLISTALGSTFSLLWNTLHPSDVPQGAITVARSASSVIATAAAVAVARSGGLRPLAVYLAYAGVIAALGVVRAFAVAPLLLEQGFPPEFIDPWPALIRNWTTLAGIAIGLAFARYVGIRRAVPTNAFLEAAGARVVVPSVALALIGIAAPLTDQRFVGLAIAVVFAGSIAAGLVIAVRAQVLWRTALLLAGLIALTWIWPLGFSQVQIAIQAGHGLAQILPAVIPLAEAALVVLAALIFNIARGMRHSLPT